MRLLVCGGRDFADKDRLHHALDFLDARRAVAVLIHGAAPGADILARDWAIARGIPHEPYPADWGAHGRAAGPIRNKRMLDEGRPDGVVAFPGGRGTQNMVKQAMAAGIKVWTPFGIVSATPSATSEQ